MLRAVRVVSSDNSLNYFENLDQGLLGKANKNFNKMKTYKK